MVGVVLTTSLQEQGWAATSEWEYQTLSINGKQVVFFQNWQDSMQLNPIVEELHRRGAQTIFLPPDTPLPDVEGISYKPFTGKQDFEAFLAVESIERQNANSPILYTVICFFAFGMILFVFISFSMVINNAPSAITTRQRMNQAVEPVKSRSFKATMQKQKQVARHKTDYSDSVQPTLQKIFTFVHGNDSFEEAVAVEGLPANKKGLGEFFGEVGLSIASSYDTRHPFTVTSFALYTFDVASMQTIQHVFISEHVASNLALRDRIVGDVILTAERNVSTSIQTGYFLVEARVLDLAYRLESNLPAQCVFETFSLEVTVWLK